MTSTLFENNDPGKQNLKVWIGEQFKEYSSWPQREIHDPVNGVMKEPAFPDPVTSFSQLTVGAGWILVS